MSVRCHIGLGSNIGDRLGSLQRAVDALRATPGIDVTELSGVYETDPVGPPQPDFLNAVVEIRTSLGPHELLATLKRIEREAGRREREPKPERWGPREIDLDLLLYGDETIDEGGLRVPHPQMRARAFVLVPLGEIAPDLVTEDVDRAGVRTTGHRLT